MTGIVQTNTNYSHLHSRHLSNLEEYNREFVKVKANIKRESDRQELMQGRSSQVYSSSGYDEQYQRMENAHEMIDEILL